MGFVFNTSTVFIRSMISRSVKELLKQITIRGMYFYSIKSCFYGVLAALKIFYRSFNIFNGHFPWRNSNFKSFWSKCLIVGIDGADNGNAPL
jgi:hypothetical protein